MWNSTTLETSLHKSITTEFLNDMYREPHLALDNLFVSILSLQRISANDRQFAEFESNSEVKLPPHMKMKTSIDIYRFGKNDADCIQDDNHFAQPQRSHQLLAIRNFSTD